MPSPAVAAAIAAVPPGAYAVGVSGGVDSVALLLLLRQRPDLALEVVHLNHETRLSSYDDAQFVFDLAASLGLNCLTGHWHGVERTVAGLPKNRSARFRAGRFALFRHVVKMDQLDGVMLAHHADDVAETVLQRLLRGGPVTGLAALRPRATINGLTVLRPLLGVRRSQLRQFLLEQNQPWRDDESNTSPRYQRNRLRAILTTRPDLTDALLSLGSAAGELKEWLRRTAPRADAKLPVGLLQDLPTPLALETARRWLTDRGAAPGELTTTVLQRLLDMSTDAAAPPRQHFPRRVLVRRRSGLLFVEPTETGSIATAKN